jgi:hypothetical protein
MRRNVFWLVIDILVAAAILCSVWLGKYLMPQNGVQAQQSAGMQAITAEAEESALSAATGTAANTAETDQGAEASVNTTGNTVMDQTTSGNENISSDAATNATANATEVHLSQENWKKKFAGQFTDQVVVTENSYTSPDLSIHLTRKNYDTGISDKSENGKHLAYGTSVSYILADIYVADIRCLQTAFAQNTYGVGYTEKLSDMSAALRAVLAVNGDSYSNNHNWDNGTIIRNGIIYRSMPSDMETCVLNWDGTMQILPPGTADRQSMIKSGAYQTWVFGPSLLNQDGTAKTSFLTSDYINESHPRTAIGYYEPGHYCLLLVDGRQKTSRGMFLTEMSDLFAGLGCKAAYNLDGGHCSFMLFNGTTANNPYKPQHEIPDGIFLKELHTAPAA